MGMKEYQGGGPVQQFGDGIPVPVQLRVWGSRKWGPKTALPQAWEDPSLLSPENVWEVGQGTVQTGWPLKQWMGRRG